MYKPKGERGFGTDKVSLRNRVVLAICSRGDVHAGSCTLAQDCYNYIWIKL